jgi:hypothetical protein
VGVTRLGNVFESFESDQPRGPDLRVSVEVPRAALGGSLRVAVPQRLAADGDLVERASDPADPEHLLLHLPTSLPEGAVLRLRGQGGVLASGQPGDLFVALELVERPMRADEGIPGGGGDDRPSFESIPPSAGLTWLILLGLAMVAATTVWVFFA